jgi:hypothetical protein
MATIPENNFLAYELLYKLEVGLREFLIDTFGREDQKWWKLRLPPDVLGKLKDGREKERKIKWVELLPHHPIYYIDFPDLKKIIEVKDNWRDAFQTFFGDKDVFCGGLRELEPIRNKIAHSRKISDNEVHMLKGNIAKFESAIGKERWDKLILGQTVEPSISEKIISLKDFSSSTFQKMNKCSPLENLDTWNILKQEWWFDGVYLCQDITPVEKLYAVADNYLKLPRHRGSGHIIENWVKQNLTQELYRRAEETFGLLLAQKGA